MARLVVEENNLQVQVVTLRKLFGPQAIATIPGRGYRFTLVVDGARRAGASGAGAACPDGGCSAHQSVARCRAAVWPRSRPHGAGGALGESRVVTIVGAGGIGKTRLARAVTACRSIAGPTAPGSSSWHR